MIKELYGWIYHHEDYPIVQNGIHQFIQWINILTYNAQSDGTDALDGHEKAWSKSERKFNNFSSLHLS